MRTGRLAASRPTRDRRARVAVAALFLTNGALFANLLPRYPEIKADLGLSNAGYGVAIAAFSVGALVTGPLAATLIRRYRSSRVAVCGSVAIAVFAWFAVKKFLHPRLSRSHLRFDDKPYRDKIETW